MKTLTNYIYLVSALSLLLLVALKPIKQEQSSGFKNNASAEITNNLVIYSNSPQVQPVSFTINKKDQTPKAHLSCCKIPSGKNRFGNVSQ